MPYDDAEFNVNLMAGPILASFASGLKCTATDRTGTSVNVTDRVEFFRNVKLTGIKAITRSSGAATSAPLSKVNPHVILTDGTNVLATCQLGTVAGFSASGGISSTYPNADADEALQLQLLFKNDGTARTGDVISADVYLEYQNRF